MCKNRRNLRDGSEVKSSCWFYKGPGFSPSNHVKLQPFLTRVPGYPVASSVLFLQQVQCHR